MASNPDPFSQLLNLSGTPPSEAAPQPPSPGTVPAAPGDEFAKWLNVPGGTPAVPAQEPVPSAPAAPPVSPVPATPAVAPVPAAPPPVTTPEAAPVVAADDFSKWLQVPGAPAAALAAAASAPATPVVTAAQTPEQISKVNNLNAQSAKELADNKSADVLALSKDPDLQDPVSQQKILDAFKLRVKAPIDWGEVGKAAILAPGGLAISLFKGGSKLMEELGNFSEGVRMGDKARVASAVGEVASAPEVGSISLLASINSALDTLLIHEHPSNGHGPQNDADWAVMMHERAGWQQNVADAASGKGLISEDALRPVSSLAGLVLGKDAGKSLSSLKTITEKLGGSIDPENVQAASTILDPTLWVPLLAGLRTTRVAAGIAEAGFGFQATENGIRLASAAGKTILDAPKGSVLFKSLDAISTATEATTATAKNVGPVLAKDAAEGMQLTGSALANTGKGIEWVRDTTGGWVKKIFSVADKAGDFPGSPSAKIRGTGGMVTGGLIGGAVEHALGGGFLPGVAGAAAAVKFAPPILKGVGGALTDVAQVVRGAVPAGPLWQKAASTAGSLVKGAAAGVGLTGDPLALGFTGLNVAAGASSEAPDKSAQIGTGLGSQAAFGAGGVLLHAGASAVKSGLDAAKPFWDIADQLGKPAASSQYIPPPDYSAISPELDALNKTSVGKLDPKAQTTINQAAHAVAGEGTVILTLPEKTFGDTILAAKIRANNKAGVTQTDAVSASYRALAQDAAQAQGIFMDNLDLGDGVTRKVILLNENGGALQHEGTHLFLAIEKINNPENYRRTFDLAKANYSPEEQTTFLKNYRKKLNNPTWGEGPGGHDKLIEEMLAENGSMILNGQPIETLGTPKPVARSLYQLLGQGLEQLGGRVHQDYSPLGARQDVGVGRALENIFRAQQAEANPPPKAATKVDFSKVPLGPKVTSKGGVSPVIQPAGPPYIRTSASGQRALWDKATALDATTADKAVVANKNLSPQNKTAYNVIRASTEQNVPVQLDHSSVATESFNAGRDIRRAEQAVPDAVRQATSKVMIPTRVETREGGVVQVVGMSMDKVVQNAQAVVADAFKNGVADQIPFENADGSLTPAGWKSYLDRLQQYGENHSNGVAGSGAEVRVPKGYTGSVPPRQAGYVPHRMPLGEADFVNLTMALPPPKTNRPGTTKVPVNITARSLAEANQRPVMPSVTSNPKKNIFEGHNIQIGEFNPLRDSLAKAGVDVRNLIEVTERVNVANINKATPRPDLKFARPETDLIRAGFMPKVSPVKEAAGQLGVTKDAKTKADLAEAADLAAYGGYVTKPPFEKPAPEKRGIFGSPLYMPKDIATPESLKETLKGKDWAIMSAEKAGRTPEENAAATHALAADLAKAGHKVTPTEGNYGGTPEKSFFVRGITSDEAHALGNKFNQDSVLVPEGLRYSDNTVHPHDGTVVTSDQPFKENYTTIPDTGQHFQYGLDFSKKIAAPEATGSKSSMIAKAVATPGVEYNYVVGRTRDGGIGNYEQVDAIHNGDSIVSSNPKDLNAAGAKIPTVPDWVPQGRYTQAELEKLIADHPVDTAIGGTHEDFQKWLKEHGSDTTVDPLYKPKTAAQHGGDPLEHSVGGELKLIHFGGTGMKNVDPAKFGASGITPRSELAGAPRSYFYEQGKAHPSDVTGRPGVYGATVSGNRIYDGNADKLGHGDIINREKADQMLQDAGYVGIARTGMAGKKQYRQVELFKPTKVQPLDNQNSKFMPKATPAQETQLADSKVRGEDGKLLPVFHGTYSDFKEFGMGDLGYHFGTNDAANARTGNALTMGQVPAERGYDAYAEQRAHLPPSGVAMLESITDGVRTIPAFLDLKNPLRMMDVGPWNQPDDVWSYLPKKISESPKMEKASLAIDRYTRLRDNAPNGDTETPPIEKATKAAQTAIRDGLKSLGYDGIVYKNDFESGGAYEASLKGPPQHSSNFDSYIAFDNKQIIPAYAKNASAHWMPKTDSLGFHSNIEKSLEDWQPKGSPEQLMAHLGKSGGTKEEANWIGLPDFLKGKTSVTKDEVAQFVAANKVNLQEVTHAHEPLYAWRDKIRDLENRVNDAAYNPRDEAGNQSSQDAGKLSALEAELTALRAAKPDVAGTKYKAYTLPGGENYREHLLTMPEHLTESPEATKAKADYKASVERQDQLGRAYNEARQQLRDHYGVRDASSLPYSALEGRVGGNGPLWSSQGLPPKEQLLWKNWERGIEDMDAAEPMHLQARAAAADFYREKDDNSFKSGHWAEPNIVVHTRTTDRTGAGQSAEAAPNTLFLEEVQSDLHQKGRQEGYTSPGAKAAASKEYSDALQHLDERQFDLREAERAYDAAPPEQFREAEAKKLVARQEYDAAQRRLVTAKTENTRLLSGGVPDFPFKTSWPKLALKRMIALAAQEGKDQIAWTTGDQQAARYDLSKSISSIQLHSVRPNDPTASRYLTAFDHSGVRVMDEMVGSDNAENNTRIGTLIGKEAAKKLFDSPWYRASGEAANGMVQNEHLKTLSGLDLKVGGEGMKGFYDKILPELANQIGKKYGARADTAVINTAHNTELSLKATPVHVLKITPELKAAALSGQPMFMPKTGGEKMAVPGNPEPQDVLKSAAFRSIAKNLTPEELKGMNRGTAQSMVDIYKELPPDSEFNAAAQAGLAKKGWYERAGKTIRAIFGADTDRFAHLLSATSPQVPVRRNLDLALNIWADWQDAGRPLDPGAIRKITSKYTNLEAHIPNSIRALRGEELSGPKVNPFAKNVLGDSSVSTNDSWMGLFGNMKPGQIGTVSGGHAFTAKIRKTAGDLGFTPAEVQETIWSLFKTLSEATTGKQTASEALHGMTDAQISNTPEFHDLLMTDPEIRAQLERLGFTGLDQLPPLTKPANRPGSTLDVALQEGGQSRVRALKRVAFRVQAQHDAKAASKLSMNDIKPSTDESAPW